MKINVDELKVLKMINGEIVISEIVEEKDNKVVLRNPLNIIIGAEGPVPINYVMFSDDEEITINSTNVMFIVTASEDTRKYVQQLTKEESDLIVPEKNIII